MAHDEVRLGRDGGKAISIDQQLATNNLLSTFFDRKIFC